MQEIFTKLLYMMQERHSAMLLTIVAENGSAPRGVGAQMLVARHGAVAGSIGGGAVEYRSIQLAQGLLSKQKNATETFALHPAEKDDIGMVCGGDVTVSFRYIAYDDSVWRALSVALLERIRKHQSGWLILRTDGGAPALVAEDRHAVCGNFSASDCDLKSVSSITDKYISLPLPIGERAVLFGAGHCAMALAPLLKTIGFRVVVFDDRAALATQARFPSAEEVICGDYHNIGQYLTLQENDYAVVMTNGHTHDLEVEAQLLRQPLAYVGVIGSRSKTAAVNQRLRQMGISEDAIASVHTPVGTPIKAVTPEEIAVSIAGEMIYERACRRETT